MPCYHPQLLGNTYAKNPETGKFIWKFLGPAHELTDDDQYRVVPCNRCIGCRLDYAREWSNRMVLELMENPNAVFVTLTYDEENVPKVDSPCVEGLSSKSLNVRDVQLFHKKLRKHFSGRKIRYFLAGEYGPTSFRPHYHAIYFGLSFDDFPDLTFHHYNENGDPVFISKILADIWSHGFITIGGVTRKTCGYTARYMLNKLKGNDTKYYEFRGIKPEFTLSSRRPGIGMGYIESHPDPDAMITFFDGRENVSFPLPKKVFDKYADLDPNLYDEIKDRRRSEAFNRQFLELQKTDLSYLEYLGLKETELYERIKSISGKTRKDI